ncbi:MAG: hypothetical protein O7J95_20800 [Planctomycetota bacterium]|nr:hypothetical protein [Planctomycetota bacterium]
MIAVPIVGIIAVVVSRSVGNEEPAAVAKDENVDLRQLTDEVPELERDGYEVIRLLRKESPQAGSRAAAFRERIDGWLDRWESLTQGLRDAEGAWKPEFAGYSRFGQRVSRLRNDFLKVDNF